MRDDDQRAAGPPGPPGPAGPMGHEGGDLPHPAQLAVGVVGAGRAGTAMAVALARAGHRVVAASAVSQASADRISRSLPQARVTAPEQVVEAADLVLLTVPDDALPDLVAGLAATGVRMEGRLVAHASGRHGLAVLGPAVRAGALPLALHPGMTFTGRPDDIDKMAGICFGITAPDSLRTVAEALVLEMGGEPVFIAEEHRDLYHAALASASNYLVTLVAQASDLLRDAGVADPARMLGPLLGAALDNALRLGDAALTGPVARGDADTVASHIAALRAASPESLPVYLALARLTADRALSAGTLAAPRAQRAARAGGAGPDHGCPAPGPPGPAPAGPGDLRPERKRRGVGVREPAPVRSGRGLRPLPAYPGTGYGRLRRRGRRGGVRAVPRTDVSSGTPGHGRSGPGGTAARGQLAPRLLRRGADRGAEAVPARRARRGGLRPEGRAAARADPADDRRPRSGRGYRLGTDRARPGRARRLQPERLPVACGAVHGADAAARARGRGQGRGRRPRGGARGRGGRARRGRVRRPAARARLSRPGRPGHVRSGR